MKKNWKKVLSMILAASLVFSLSTAAFAAEVEEEIQEIVGAGEELAGAVEVEAEVDDVTPVGDVPEKTSDNRVLSFNMANTDEPISQRVNSVSELSAAGTFTITFTLSNNKYNTLKDVSGNVSFNKAGEAILEFPTVSGAKFTFPVIKAVISDNEYEVTEWDGKKPGADGEVVSGNNTYKATWKKVEKTPEEPELTDEEKAVNDLSQNKTFILKGSKYAFKISANKALQYTGMKHDATKEKAGKQTKDVVVQIGYMEASKLPTNADDATKVDPDTVSGFTPIKGELKVKVKNNLNATVSGDGTALESVLAGKNCYFTVDIKSAQGLDKNTLKAIKKDLKELMKKEQQILKDAKKAKKSVSADGTVNGQKSNISVAIYPVFTVSDGTAAGTAHTWINGADTTQKVTLVTDAKKSNVKMKGSDIKNAKITFNFDHVKKAYTAKLDKLDKKTGGVKKTNGVSTKSTKTKVLLTGNVYGWVDGAKITFK